MKKSELKKVLKPIIKECVKEALFEEGILSGVISEVVKGLGTTQQLVVEDTRQNEDEMKKMQLQEKQKRSHKMKETRKKMLDVIGKDSYNGVDLFEGTTPVSRAGNPGEGSTPQGALAGTDPRDSGVDISAFMGNKNVWKALAGGK
jgi:nitrogen regulatory protein PII